MKSDRYIRRAKASTAGPPRKRKSPWHLSGREPAKGLGRSRGTQYFQPRRKTNPALVNSVLKLHRIAMQEQERRSPNTGSMRHRHPDACR
jgi:hypothetical protein